MNEHSIAADLDWFRTASESALRRAAVRARHVARETNTRLIVYRDNELIAMRPDELDKEDEQAS